MTKNLLLLLWVTFPISANFLVLFAFWWPREGMPWGRLFAMSFVSGILTMLYAGCASDIFDKIQALAL